MIFSAARGFWLFKRFGSGCFQVGQALDVLAERLHARHQGTIHSAELGAPLIKRSRTHAKLTADVRNLDSGISSPEHLHDLAVTKTGLPHVEPLPSEKILLLTTPI